MAKVYKSKNNKLIIQVPFDVVTALGIKEGDDLDFLEYMNNTYIVAKKNDIVKLLAKPKEERQVATATVQSRTTSNKNVPSVDPKELELLKKLDTMRYSDRTNTKVNPMLSTGEKDTLQSLIKKKIVVPFRKGNEKEVHYSIQKAVYDMFLYRKGKTEQATATVSVSRSSPPQRPQQVRPNQRAWEQNLNGDNAYTDLLESKGYVVLSNEADAAMVSAALEDSIRQGLVVGTRAFNKKFYIGLRGYINKNAGKILKLIENKSMDVGDISKESGVEEDGIRTILYVLAESGDVTEVRRDTFRVA